MKQRFNANIAANWLLIAFLFAQYQPLLAGNTNQEQQTVVKSGAPPATETRQFDPLKLEEYRNNPDYQYKEKPYKPTWFTRLLHQLESLLNQLFNTTATDNFYKILKYFLVAAFILILVSALTNVKITDIFFRKPMAKLIPAHEFFEENIHTLHFDQLITEAINKQDYRKAIRLRYLQTLKLLADINLIDWQPNKTNRDYQSELFQTTLYNPFAQVTRVFNYVWYGNFDIDAQHFVMVNEQFSNFNNRLKQQAKL